MAKDFETRAHLEWLGYVQPVGMVVNPPALLAAQAHINSNIRPEHERFLDLLTPEGSREPLARIPDLPAFFQVVLGWRSTDLEPINPADPRYQSLEVPLREYGETLRPTHVVRAVPERGPQASETGGASPWMMLVQDLPAGTDLDLKPDTKDSTWQESPQVRFERLLRETQVPIGLLCNRASLRLVYAPRGESSGYLTFGVAAMAQVAGRPIFAAMHLLLSSFRLFSADPKFRLPAILSESRKYQNEVSTKLAQQVLAALYELLRGFQAAHDQSGGKLLAKALAKDPDHVYQGLLTILMRLVFVLYAEDRGLLSSDPTFVRHYSLGGLFDRLRADAGRFIDTMDQRYGAWAQILALFRVLHDGCKHKKFHIPARRGHLFDPEIYPFLEGREYGSSVPGPDESFPVPRVADGVVFRVLQNLLILDGERLSYRTLDVEQIGSVYETMMGFSLKVAQGRSLALKPKKKQGAPGIVNLDGLLEAKPADRAKLLKEQTEQELSGEGAAKLKEARSIEDLAEAVAPKIATMATPQIVPKGSMLLEPSDERRRSGSHYTPRSLTQPIVAKALEPILVRLGALPPYPEKDGSIPPAGPFPRPEAILDLCVCDPAMGSGAFLVEACRQLAEVLVKSWYEHKCLPKIPEDEDELLYAKRLIAQRCLYGVDKNPMAVNLAKLSLWLATLAKEHPFTFLDHSLRAGDSLVGLTRKQIAAFHWEPDGGSQKALWSGIVEKRVREALKTRRAILEAGDFEIPEKKRQKLALADESLDTVRFIGDLAIAAFFGADSAKAREAKRMDYLGKLVAYLGDGQSVGLAADFLKRPTREVEALHHPPPTPDQPKPQGVQPFHWEIEFPEVFGRENPGFDVIVGNPPFLGGTKITGANGTRFLDYLKSTTMGAGDRADLVAYFFRRCFFIIRSKGCFGLIATNTIGEGDTREAALEWLCENGGTIFFANKRLRWPGEAAVVVSVIHFVKDSSFLNPLLNGIYVPRISAFLFPNGSNVRPRALSVNNDRCFEGMVPYGSGFLFCDDTPGAHPLSYLQYIKLKCADIDDVVFPFIGGEEINDHPQCLPSRSAIYFQQMPLAEVRSRWPLLVELLEKTVKPERESKGKRVSSMPWWHFLWPRPELWAHLISRPQSLVRSKVSKHHAFVFLPQGTIPSNRLAVFLLPTFNSFAVLQWRGHEDWALRFGSTLEDRPVYTANDCFDTFPFPENFESDAVLEAAGKEYYEYRAALMVRNDEGLTKTYNRFHDPGETSSEIARLRELHAAMDRAVLAAYGWLDVQPACGFILDWLDLDDEELSETLAIAPGDIRDRIETADYYFSDAESACRFQSHIKKFGKRKLPWRYRWPDEVRDEVLARLLDLNAKRAEEERLLGARASTEKPKPTQSKPRSRRPKPNNTTPDLFGSTETDDDPGPVQALARKQNPPQRSKESLPVEFHRPVPIDQRETNDIMAAFRQVTRGRSWFHRDQLLREVASFLGFQRLGSKTEAELRNHLRTAIRRNILETEGPELVRCGAETLADLPLDCLRDVFKSVMDKVHAYEREEVITCMARHLGFLRTSEVAREAIRSAINSGIRRGLLATDGKLIWRLEGGN